MVHSKKTEILITGATGTIGTALCQQLSEKAIPFRAMSRSKEDAEKIKTLHGAEIVIADFDKPDTLEKALEGINHAFLLTSSSEKTKQLQLNFVQAAQKANLEHIVKLSQYLADANSPVRFLRYHAAVEQKIKDVGIHYTFLRPNLFMQGLLGFKEPIAHQGKFFATLGKAKVSLIDIRDIAAVAAEALQGTSHYNKIYNLTGPEALTHDEIAEKLSKALDKPVEYVNVSDEEMLKSLLAVGFPEWQAHGLIEDYAHYARGEAENVTITVKEVTGQEPRKFETFAHDYAQVFK